MTEPRKQTLPKEVIFTKQPSHQTMMILSVNYHLRLLIEIHTWVLIHLVMNSIALTPINLAHLCLLNINFNTDYSDPIQILNLIHETSPTEMDWSYIFARTYIQTFESRGKRCYKSIMLKPFKSLRPQEICMEFF